MYFFHNFMWIYQETSFPICQGNWRCYHWLVNTAPIAWLERGSVWNSPYCPKLACLAQISFACILSQDGWLCAGGRGVLVCAVLLVQFWCDGFSRCMLTSSYNSKICSQTAFFFPAPKSFQLDPVVAVALQTSKICLVFWPTTNRALKWRSMF